MRHYYRVKYYRQLLNINLPLMGAKQTLDLIDY